MNTLSIGPYRLEERLGAGAQGSVYRGVHVETGAPAAVKVLARIQSRDLLSFRREIHVLRGIDHRGVVRLFDDGIENGRPWYAMELCEGTTLRSLLPFAPDQRTRGLELLCRICSVLAYLHGEGIVHRDLKPENIFVRPGDLPIIVDFGLVGMFAGASGREVLDTGAARAGTPSYIAPEQITGERIDARADIYSLGCMLHEVLAGHPPFVGHPVQVMRAHVEQQPPPIEAASPALAALAASLMAKEPSKRPGYAEDVAAALIAQGAQVQIEDRPRAYLYRPDFVGRRELLDSAQEILSAAKDRKPACILLGGESGVGKTRLAAEIAQRASQLKLRTISATCMQRGGGPLSPLRPFLEAVADRCLELGEEESERLLGQRGSVLAEIEPMLSHVPGRSSWPKPAALDPKLARSRLFRYLERTISAFAEIQPLLLIVDDLQWADDTTLEFFATWLAHIEGDLPCVLLATYRTEEVTTALNALTKLKSVTALELERLPGRQIGPLVGSMLAMPQPPAAFVEFLERESEGNPFFVTEYLRLAVSEGLLHRDRLAGWSLGERGADYRSLPLPGSLRDLVQLRLADLSERALRYTRVAAVVGRSFDAEIVREATGTDDRQELGAIQELLARQVLETRPDGTLAFAHDKLREVAQEGIDPQQLPEIHARIAEAMERKLAADPNLEQASALGRHFREARQGERALLYLVRAAELSAAVYVHDDAIRLYGWALDASPDPAMSARLREARGDALMIRARNEEARAEFLAVRDAARLEDRVTRARLTRKAGQALDKSYKNDAALADLREAERILGEDPAGEDPAWHHEWIDVQIELASALYFLAKTADSGFDIARLRTAVEARGTPQQRARFFVTSTNFRLRNERYVASRETITSAEAMLEAAEDSGDEGEIGYGLFLVGFTYLWHGDLERALRFLKRGLDQAVKIGDRLAELRCLNYLAHTHRRERSTAGVERFAPRTLELAEQAGVAAYAAAAKAQLGWVAWTEGNFEKARELLDHAARLWDGGVVVWAFRWLALMPAIAIDAEEGKLEAAVDRVRAVLAPTEERLADAVADPLSMFLEKFAAGDRGAAKTSLRTALKAARAAGYI